MTASNEGTLCEPVGTAREAGHANEGLFFRKNTLRFGRNFYSNRTAGSGSSTGISTATTGTMPAPDRHLSTTHRLSTARCRILTGNFESRIG
jgi:hypothetical protein